MNKILEKYFNPDAIKLAFFRVQCWPDKMVKDQVGIRSFKSDLENNCRRLSVKIINSQYKPQRGFKFYVPKSSKTLRTKTTLFIEDAILYQAIADQIAKVNYDILDQYSPFVFGSILNVDVKKGATLLEEESPNFFFFKFWQGLHKKYSESIIQAIEVDKVKYKFETDITGFFDSIPHYNLLLKLSTQFGVEDEILDLLSNCLNIWSGTKEGPTPGVGIPQGPPPSFLLANLLLHQLDQKIIEHGYRYYRYMDDISIYSYEENDLIDALLLIDQYTKTNALSINSKKTSIQEIIEGEEDPTVKELKRIRVFNSYAASDEQNLEFSFIESVIENKSAQKIEKDLARLSVQDNPNDQIKITTISDAKEIISYWEKQILDVETELPNSFINNIDEPLIPIDTLDDIDAIRLSSAYGIALRELRYLGHEMAPNPTLLKYWFYFYEKYFWRADKLGYTIMNYRYSRDVKEKMTDMLEGIFAKYEWGKYHVIQNISLTQNFEEKELRQVYFKMLKNEDSDLVKISLYRLLYKHSKTQQFRATLQNQLNKEDNQYLKVVVAEFNKFHNTENMKLDDFLNSIGL